MAEVIKPGQYRGPVQAVVLDWAGTAVDYGCLGPVAVFVALFRERGIDVSIGEARRFMGLGKRDHIREMCALPRVLEQWRRKYGRDPGDEDVDALHEIMEPMMIEGLHEHCGPVPGLLDFTSGLRRQGVKVGTCTGYTRPIMEALVPQARRKGFVPDTVVCSSDVPAGRPYPWMCYLNAIQLEVFPLESMVKIGDTVADIGEGLHAGMWTIAVTQSGNELGLAENEVARLDPMELRRRLERIEERFTAAGAHYVVDGIWECRPIIDAISERLARGERP